MSLKPLSLKVLAAYARDMGSGVVRIDHKSMDMLGVKAGDTVEVFSNKEGIDAKCYPLLPSDEDQGITRMDPEVRKAIGIPVDEFVTIRTLGPVPSENFELGEAPGTNQGKDVSADNDHATGPDIVRDPDSSPSLFTLAGSCLDFDKERAKLMDFLTTLEAAAHSKSKARCYSDGKKVLGWDFSLLELDESFVVKLLDLYPDIHEQEAGTSEERFALWMNKQLKKRKLEFRLKLSDVPQEKVGDFRLNPEHFRDKDDFGDLK